MNQVQLSVSTCVAAPLHSGTHPTPSIDSLGALAPSTNTLRRTGRIEFPKAAELPGRKKKDASFPVLGLTRRKPTLIRHLGGHSGPKGTFEPLSNPMRTQTCPFKWLVT